MPKWKRKFNQYLKKHPKRDVTKTVYGSGNPANSLIRLGSPFSYGNCVLWGKGEEEARKLKLQEEDDGM